MRFCGIITRTSILAATTNPQGVTKKEAIFLTSLEPLKPFRPKKTSQDLDYYFFPWIFLGLRFHPQPQRKLFNTYDYYSSFLFDWWLKRRTTRRRRRQLRPRPPRRRRRRQLYTYCRFFPTSFLCYSCFQHEVTCNKQIVLLFPSCFAVSQLTAMRMFDSLSITIQAHVFTLLGMLLFREN